MGLVQRLKNFFAGKQHPRPAHSIQRTTPMARRGAYQVLLAYGENGWLQSCVNLVADGVATAQWRAFKRVARGSKMAVRDPSLKIAPFEQRQKMIKALRESHELIEMPSHEILSILAAPNADFSGRVTMALLVIHYDLVGECFLWLQRNEAGRVVGFIPIPPHAVTSTPTKDRPVYQVHYEVLQGAVSVSDMLWLRRPNPAAPHGRGTGLGLGLGDELDSSENIARSLKSAFARGGMPMTVVGLETGTDGDAEEEADQLEAKWKSDATGPDSQGRPFFTPAKLTTVTVNPDLKALQTQELQKQLLDYVRMTFNVPPELMGDLTSSNRSTAEAAMYHLAEYALMPRLEFLRAELMHKLVPLIDPEVILEYEDPRPKSFERSQSLMTSPVTAPSFTKNEARQLAGFEPDPALEGQYLDAMPGTFKPGEEPTSAAPASEAGADPVKAWLRAV